MGTRHRDVVKRATVLGVMAAVWFSGATGPSWAEVGELETFIRIRIEIGETMTKFMREQGNIMDRSMEALQRMEGDINAMVAKILEPYNLTIEEYRARRSEVFKDEEAVNAFFEQHPDLKKQSEALPLPPARGPRGGP